MVAITQIDMNEQPCDCRVMHLRKRSSVTVQRTKDNRDFLTDFVGYEDLLENLFLLIAEILEEGLDLGLLHPLLLPHPLQIVDGGQQQGA